MHHESATREKNFKTSFAAGIGVRRREDGKVETVRIFDLWKLGESDMLLVEFLLRKITIIVVM